MKRRASFSISVLMAVACGREQPVSERAVARPQAKPAPAPASASAPLPPSFRRDVVPAIVEHCATAAGCHGPDPTESVDLDLGPSSAYESLVEAGSEVRPGAFLVVPFEPDESFLLTKLTGPLGASEGKLMPFDPDTGEPIHPSPVTRAELEALTHWIEAGAAND